MGQIKIPMAEAGVADKFLLVSGIGNLICASFRQKFEHKFGCEDVGQIYVRVDS